MIAVIGAGWAGLSCAIALKRSGCAVTVFDSARQAGGRASSSDGQDNGQHLAIGAYENMLELMSFLGLDHGHYFRRLPLSLNMLGDEPLELPPSRLPAPLHLLSSLLRARGLNEKPRALIALNRLMKYSPAQDITVKKACEACGVPSGLSQRMLDPLCLAALNTPANEASFEVFRQVLQLSFKRRRHHSDLLIPIRPLGEILAEPAIHWLESQGCVIHLRTKIEKLHHNADGWYLESREGQSGPYQHIVLATPAEVSRRLLQEHDAALSQQLKQLRPSAVTSVYLSFAESALPQPLYGLLDGPGEWVFDALGSGELSVVISGNSAQARSHDLVDQVENQLRRHFPHLGERTDSRKTSVAHAAFDCVPGINAIRPGNRTGLNGMYLAGDYTATGLPATLESAIISGLEAANIIKQDLA